MTDAGRWDSGLKTLPSPQRRSRSRERWDLENSKTLPHRSVSPGPGPVRAAEWHSGLKTLEADEARSNPFQRRSRSAPRERPPAADEEEWQGLRKVVDYSPTHRTTTGKTTTTSTDHHHHAGEHWLNENFKVLDVAVRRSATPQPDKRTPDSRWHNDLDKTLERGRRRRGYRHITEPPRSQVIPRTAADPAEGSWMAENFKVLDPNRDCVSPKHRFVHNGEWESGFKTVQGAPVHQEAHPPHGQGHWLYENLKVLDDHGRKRNNLGVITETGWDSGLYKTLDFPRRHQRTDSEYLQWVGSGRHLPNRPRPQLRGTERWDKVVPSPHRSLNKAGHWAQPTLPQKTLPPEVEYAKSHGREYVRHVDMPRRRDMWEFHQRVCANGSSTGSASGSNGGGSPAPPPPPHQQYYYPSSNGGGTHYTRVL